MKRAVTVLLPLLTLVLLLTFGFKPTDVNAEEVDYQISSYLVRVDFIPVPDVEKHAIGTYERRGVAVFKNGETAAYHTRGTWDFIDSNGPFQGYTTLNYKDGSMTLVKYEGEMSKPEGASLPTLKGKGDFIKGTGKYEGIKGNVSFTGEYVTPYGKETKGDSVMNVRANYTLTK